MLIVAIPKSASTSLMTTLGRLHKMESVQDFSFSDAPAPTGCRILYKYHSDVRTLTDKEVELFNRKDVFHKQHIYPSIENLALLQNTKKVVLLRPVDQIVKAYWRGAKRGVHNLLEGFDKDMSLDQWIERSRELGLEEDLKHFYAVGRKRKR